MTTQGSQQEFLHLMAKQIDGYLAKNGVKPVWGTVRNVRSDGWVNVQRRGESQPDSIYYPVVTPAYKPVSGDTIFALGYGPHLVVMGPYVEGGNRDVLDLDNNKLERNGTQNMPGRLQVRPGSYPSEGYHAELAYPNYGVDNVIRQRYHNEGRWWHRVEGRRDGFHFQTGDFNSDAHSNVYAGNFHGVDFFGANFFGATRNLETHEHDHRYYTESESDNRYYTKNHTDSVYATYTWVQNNYYNRAAIDSHHHDGRYFTETESDDRFAFKVHGHSHSHTYTRTNWTNYRAADGILYMIDGFWETVSTGAAL